MEKCELHDRVFCNMEVDLKEIKVIQNKQQNTLEKQNGVLREISEALLGNKFGSIGLNERLERVEKKVVSKALVWKVSAGTISAAIAGLGIIFKLMG